MLVLLVSLAPASEPIVPAANQLARISDLEGAVRSTEGTFPDYRLRNLERKWAKRSDVANMPMIYAFLNHRQLASIRLMPEVNRMTVTSRRSGMDTICVFSRQGRTKAINFLIDKGIVAECLLDRRGTLAKQAGVPATPYFVVVSPEGKVLYASAKPPELLEAKQPE